MAGDQWMLLRPLLGFGSGCGVERLGPPWDHWQHRTGGPLPADVEDAPHLPDAFDSFELAGERVEGGQGLGLEDIARPGGGPHDAVAVRRPEEGGNFVDQLKLIAAVTDKRPQVVIHPQL